MDHHHHTSTTATRSEAERLLGIAEKLLHTRDLSGSREFALLAQETEPLLEGSDQILAITDVLLASEKRVNNNRHHDWYAILQTHPRSDADLIKRNYRRLALLLHPDKNKYPLSDSAFKLVADAWATLADPNKKNPYDHALSLYSKVNLRHAPPQPVRKSPRGENPSPKNSVVPSFWTACPYCYVLYEYPATFEDCCLRCQHCERAFHASSISSLPPVVPGKEAYYCCWGFFPLGFSVSKANENANFDNNNNNNNNNNNHNNGVHVGDENINVGNNPNSGFPNWMPGMFNPNMNAGGGGGGGSGSGVEVTDGSDSAGLGNNRSRIMSGGFQYTPPGMPVPGQKKRGRPRKNPLPV